MDITNQQVRLAARPRGVPKESDWELTSEPVPDPGDGQVTVKILMLSLDPAMRGWMTDAPSYLPPVAIGDVMRAGALGQVIASRHPDYSEGDHVVGVLGAQEYAVAEGAGLTKVDGNLAPLPTFLGALGMTGLTAYFGLLEIGQAKEGDTVVVSGAAGAVGSVAGQIAKIKGCRAIGIAGGVEKCRFAVEELGFDAAIDYKADDVARALRREAPDGIDVYFDNVGGDILDAALANLAMRAHVVLCGAISQYNEDRTRGPSNYMMLLVRRARMEGFLVFDFASKYQDAVAELASWHRAGKLKAREDVVDGGISAFPTALPRLFRGENVGKLVLKVGEPA
jgi:NADPH-dependent curcumin reductase CurA